MIQRLCDNVRNLCDPLIDSMHERDEYRESERSGL